MIRYCNGGPNGTGTCGKPAELVAERADGLQWFCCSEHTEGGETQPIVDWFMQIDIDYDGKPDP